MTVGFARVVSDHAVFAWILMGCTGKVRKLVKQLLIKRSWTTHLQNLQRWGLTTEDAHGLYERYGFIRIERSELFMEKVSKPS